jgi:Fe-S-cluster containining protein
MFNCSGCGLCCTKIGAIIQNKESSPVKEIIDQFPYNYLEDGACEKYDKVSKKCTVYETRPLMCRVDEMHKHWPEVMSVEEYYRRTEAVCKILQSNQT